MSLGIVTGDFPEGFAKPNIILATDSDDIKTVALSFNLSKVEIYDRKDENAQDFNLKNNFKNNYLVISWRSMLDKVVSK